MIPQNILDALRWHADSANSQVSWPAASWNLLREAGVLARAIPREYGGTGQTPVEILRGSESIAKACATVAFALSQRESAVRRLLSGPAHLKERYLPRVASGEIFVTVGFSQLSTSHQHSGPALRAEKTSGGYILNGVLPWVTGADQAEGVVAGATLADGSQILAFLLKAELGVEIDPPMALSSLLGSRTSIIHCRNVHLADEFAMSGPVQRVLGPIGGGGLETSGVAVGIASAAIESLREYAANRVEYRPVFEKFNAKLGEVQKRLHALAETPMAVDDILALRVDCSKLALRSTQANLLAAKGTGFIVPHPAQRWCQQALFLLVWSSPRPVVDAMIADFLLH